MFQSLITKERKIIIDEKIMNVLIKLKWKNGNKRKETKQKLEIGKQLRAKNWISVGAKVRLNKLFLKDIKTFKSKLNE